jgi:AraC family transcriptional regulator
MIFLRKFARADRPDRREPRERSGNYLLAPGYLPGNLDISAPITFDQGQVREAMGQQPMQSVAQSSQAGGILPTAWARQMPVAPSLSSEALGWEKIALYRFRNPRQWQMHQPAMAWHFIAAHLANPSKLSMKLSGRWQRGRTTPGDVIIMAAQHENAWEWDGEIDEIHLCIDPALLDAAAAELSNRPAELISSISLHDPWIYQIALRLMAEVESPAAGSRLFGDLMAQALALQLLRGHTPASGLALPERSTISRMRLQRALDFIEANLADDISVDEIAAAAAVSPFHFAHGFRQSMGVSPHQYVIRQRIDRAKILLRTTDEPIAQIALSVGFAHQGHFTTAFKKHEGNTPRAYRQALRLS